MRLGIVHYDLDLDLREEAMSDSHVRSMYRKRTMFQSTLQERMEMQRHNTEYLYNVMCC